MEQNNVGVGMYLYHKARLCQIVGIYSGSTVAILRPVRDEDKNECESCGCRQETMIYEVVGCRNWNNAVEPVKTILPNNPTE